MEKTVFDIASFTGRQELADFIASAVERAQERGDMPDLYYATRYERIEGMDPQELAGNIAIALAAHPAIRNRQTEQS